MRRFKPFALVVVVTLISILVPDLSTLVRYAEHAVFVMFIIEALLRRFRDFVKTVSGSGR